MNHTIKSDILKKAIKKLKSENSDLTLKAAEDMIGNMLMRRKYRVDYAESEFYEVIK